MSRIAVRIHSVLDHDRIAEPAIARGYCATRAEVRSCRALSRLHGRGRGQYRDQQARKAFNTLPHEGPGALAYYRAVVYPNHQRRYARHVRIHGEPGYGSHID